MRTLVTTNDLVRISFLHALLRDAGIDCLLLDSHASAVEGSIGAIPRRLMVLEAFEDAGPPRVERGRRGLTEHSGIEAPGITQGTLLDGRVQYAQFASGYRTGIEPVLLAAAIPARAGQRVLEAGTGAGAGLLCLAARIPDLSGVGIERDPATVVLARRNMTANGCPFEIHEADVAQATTIGPVDHAFANPPWHDPTATPSPNPRRGRATHRAQAGLADWVHPLAAAITTGTLTLAVSAGLLGEAVTLLHGAGLARIAVLPLWPRSNVEAKILLVQARRGPAATRVLAGLILHGAGNGYTAAAEAVLRNGASLTI